MKLFIYYSLSGNGDIISNYLSKHNIDIRKVETTKPLPKNMVLRILTGGFLAGINHKDKLINFDNDITKYDEVIIGSPIWNGKLACPINTVLDLVNLENKKVTFILYSGTGEAPKTNKMLKEKYPEASIINLKEPSKNKENMGKILKNI